MADSPIDSEKKSPEYELLRQQVRRWKAGMEEVNRYQLEERRNATYAQRLASMAAIWKQAEFLGLLKPSPLDLSVNDTWQLLRQRYRDRHA